jgi:hypothetical protein
MYEQSVDRLACALGGKVVLPPAFQVSFFLFGSRTIRFLLLQFGVMRFGLSSSV